MSATGRNQQDDSPLDDEPSFGRQPDWRETAGGNDASEQTATDDDAWGADDLESAYRRALEANESVEWELSGFNATELNPSDDDAQPAAAGHHGNPAAMAPGSDTSGSSETGAHQHAAATPDPAVPETQADTPRVSVRQVIEAGLFVGGEALTTKRLCYLLRGDADMETVEQAIDELNHQYLNEDRPYEIRLGEGGYRLMLRHEFERVRHRVYGIGPREVKLSQDALEVLALVAYRQPVTQEQIEELGKENPGPLLRQLLRRELITLERDPADRRHVTYLTTRRFLSLFGLGSLEELPQADDLSFK